MQDFIPPITIDDYLWTGKCWGCGKDLIEQSQKKKLHLIYCDDCPSIFFSIESLMREKQWGNRAFE